MHTRLRYLAFLGMGLLLAACALPAHTQGDALPAQAGVGATSAAATVVPCNLQVSGARLVGPAGATVVLYGANLPTLTAMQASTYKPDARLRDLSAAGARAVRLAIDFNEETPTFVPAQVAPFVQQANQLGMIVILGWNVAIAEPPGSTVNPEADPVNTLVDDAEDWLRLEITYLSNNPGVWFDLYSNMDGLSPGRRRSIAQRLVDVARGLRSSNVIIINDPAWLFSADAASNKPLTGANLVYGLTAADPGFRLPGGATGYDAGQLPFMVTRWTGGAPAAAPAGLASLKALGIGALAWNSAMQTPSPLPPDLTGFWKANQADWAACRGR